jgi:hypothetical protein
MFRWPGLPLLFAATVASSGHAQNASVFYGGTGSMGSASARHVPLWRNGLILGSGLLLVPQLGSAWRGDATRRRGLPSNMPADRPVGAPPPWSFNPGATLSGWTFVAGTAPQVVWNSMEWSHPVDMTLSRVIRISNRVALIGAGVRYWADTPTERPRHRGLRFSITFQF